MAVSVVIVDDHAGFRAMVRRMLHDDGYEVAGEASDGAHAIELVTRLRPDLVVLDVRLPDLDGFTVTEQLRAAGVSCRVVLISSRHASDYGDRPIGCGADGFVAKSQLSGAMLRAEAGLS